MLINLLNKLNNFDICSKINENLKKTIKLFHVFNDSKGTNIIFITSDDTVYGFGSNSRGTLGLKSDGEVKEPVIISELCYRNITEIFNGSTFALALNSDNDVFGWGWNETGVLGAHKRGIEPQKLYYFNNKTIIQLSCGRNHCLALTSNGVVYGWGDNRSGQIGCGNQVRSSGNPIELNTLSEHQIKSIHCSAYSSYALTTDGRVYRWGYIGLFALHYKFQPRDKVFIPELVDLINVNVISVCMSDTNTYFLTNEGFIYFCGKYANNYQFSPKLLQTNEEFKGLFNTTINIFINNNTKPKTISTAISGEFVYELEENFVKKTNYKTLFNFYANKFNITYKSIAIIRKTSRDSDPNNSILFSSELDENGKYDKTFEQIETLGQGSYGVVYKVRHIVDNQVYAVKQIRIKNDYKYLTETMLKEVQMMADLNSRYVVDYKTAWIEKSIGICIQMEFCSHNLKDIIELKAKAFDRKPNEVINAIEFFISTEILKELFECVKYLHELKPPIIHRDLKPANILIKNNRSTGRFLKLCDFGLATFHTQNKNHSEIIGTNKYMAPEVRIGSKYDTRADVYSLGIISSEVLDLHIFNPESRNPIIDDLKLKLTSLEADIVLMTQQPNWRPTCAQIFNNYKDWSFPKSYIKKDPNFKTERKRLYNFEEKFNFEFLKQKTR